MPFLPMSMAKGLLPDDHPQSVAAARSLALRDADVVMLVGARLNWLLGHGEAPQWNPDAKFIQVDIEPDRVGQQPAHRGAAGGRHRLGDGRADRARPARARSARRREWRDELAVTLGAERRQDAQRLAADPHPMRSTARCAPIRDVLRDMPGRLCRQRGRQRAGHRPQRDRHAGAAAPAGQRHLGRHGHRHGLCDRRRRRDRRAGGGDRRRQRIRVQRHGDRDDLPLPAARHGGRSSTTAASTVATTSTTRPPDPAPTVLDPAPITSG